MLPPLLEGALLGLLILGLDGVLLGEGLPIEGELLRPGLGEGDQSCLGLEGDDGADGL
jgi:hypothetical protein